jgi:hypothetical protein
MAGRGSSGMVVVVTGEWFVAKSMFQFPHDFKGVS